MNTTYESTIEYNEDFGEYFLTIPEELIERLGLEEGDMLEWHMNKDGTVLLERVEDYVNE